MQLPITLPPLIHGDVAFYLVIFSLCLFFWAYIDFWMQTENIFGLLCTDIWIIITLINLWSLFFFPYGGLEPPPLVLPFFGVD